MTDDVAEAGNRPGLRDHLRALRRRWRIVLLVVVGVVAAALAYSLLATPRYVAHSEVEVEPSATQTATGSEVDAQEIATQTQVVTSLPVARLVREQLDLEATPDLTELVTVQPVGTSRILRITAEDTSPERAARTADIVAAAYLQFREEDSFGRYERARDQLVQEQTDIERRLREVEASIATRDPDELATLQAERRTLVVSLTQIATQLEGLNDSLTAAEAGGLLIQEAEVPREPISPQTALNLVLGALFGLVLGIGAALVRDRYDDVVHDEEAVRQALDSVVVGRIPHWSERAHRDRLVTVLDPHAPASEEYQRLGVNVRFMVAPGTHDAGAVVLVTSGQAGEGKTTTSCNLAVAAARLGMRVALIDADLRRPSVGSRFGLGDLPGLSDALVGEESPSTFLVDVGIESLAVLPAGTVPPNPAALLTSPRMRSVLFELGADVDLVVVDSPPVLTGADSLELAHLADMVIVVTRDRVSRRRQLVAVRESLRHVPVANLGVVRNDVADAGHLSYSYSSRERTAPPPGPGAQRPQDHDVTPAEDPGRRGDRIRPS